VVVRRPLVPEQIAVIAAGSGLLLGVLVWRVARWLRR